MDVDFGVAGVPDLLVDEPPPLGEGEGPNAARLLAAAVANCLSASLIFCLRKSRADVEGLEAEVRGRMVRNDRGRMRIGELAVTLHPAVELADRGKLDRCLELFEDYCIVTSSVREGLEVSVAVEPVEPVPADSAPSAVM